MWLNYPNNIFQFTFANLMETMVVLKAKKWGLIAVAIRRGMSDEFCHDKEKI